MEIRFARPEDIPAILSLLLQVGQVHHLGRPDIFRQGAQKYNARQVRAMLGQRENPIFVACEEGRVLGYGFCLLKEAKDDPVLADRRELYIDDLCVDESCRGRHIGKLLFSHIRSYAQTLGCHSVTLNVWSCNESAMGFYRSLGLQSQKVGMEMILEDR